MYGKVKKWGFVLWWLGINSILLSSCLGDTVSNSFIRTPSMLAPQGPLAGRIAGLSWFMFILGSLIYVGVMVYLAYAIWGNRGHDLEEELKRPNEGNGIVLTWGVGFTALVLAVLFGWNLGIMRADDRLRAQGSELVIDVIGRQFWWEVQYGEQGFETANEIHIPVGRPVW